MKNRFGFLRSVAVAAAMVSAPWCPAAGIRFAKGGAACAEIVTGAESAPAVIHAAKELQLAVKLVSGAELPIVSAPAGAEYRIVLSSAPDVLAKFPEDAAALKGNDGYAVRTSGNTVCILGSSPKGVLNGVYRMLARNCGIVWARPDEKLGTFYLPDADLTLTETDYRDIPAFQVRGWQVSFPIPLPDLVWNLRNCATWTSANPRDREVIRMRMELGIEQEGFYAHNIVRRFMTRDRYWETHPEYYSMQNGKRIDPKPISGIASPAQLCFTNREMVKEFLKRFDEEIAKDPHHQVYAICLEDNLSACRCPECSKPIDLPDGSQLPLGAPNFDSTRFYMFLNEVARHLNEVAPGKKITTFAYIFAEAPPAVPLEDNVQIILCPCYKDLRYPVDAPRNKTTRDHLDEWAKRGVKAVLYEYYGLAGDYPRPIDKIIAADLKYAEKLGNIVGMHSEILQDSDEESYKYRHTMPSYVFWDVNAMYIWVGTQLMWDPDQDVEALRDQFLKVVYGAAAPDVKEYFALTEKSWNTEFGVADYHTHTLLSWCALADNGLVERCRAALERAKARELDPRRREMVERLYRVFDSKRQMLADYAASKQLWQAVDADPEAAAKNLIVSPDWTFWKRTRGEGGKDESVPGGSRNTLYIMDSDNACFLQQHELEAGKLYAVRCRVRMENPDRSDGAISIRWRKKNGAWALAYDLRFPNGEVKSDEWTSVAAFFRTPPEVAKLSLQLSVEASVGKVWFDRVEMYKVDFDAAGNAVPADKPLAPSEVVARDFLRGVDSGKIAAKNLITSPRWVFWKRERGEDGAGSDGVYIKDSGEACLRQEYTLKPGRTYVVRCRFKMENPDRSDAHLSMRWKTVEDIWKGGNDVSFFPKRRLTSGEWGEISGSFTVPEKSPRLSYQLGVDHADGKVHFDKMELYLMPESTAPEGEPEESPASDGDSEATAGNNLITSPRWVFWKRSRGTNGAGSDGVWIADADEACLRQEFTLTPGKRYLVRCRVKMENSCRVRLSMRWKTVQGKWWSGNDAAFAPEGDPEPGKWVTLSGVVTVPARSPRLAYMLSAENVDGKVSFDGMELRELAAADPQKDKIAGKNMITSTKWSFWKRSAGSSDADPDAADGSPQCRYIADADEACLRQEYTLKPGKRYLVRCRVRMEDPARGKVRLSARWQTTQGKWWSGNDAAFAPQGELEPGKWAEISGTVTVPARSPRLSLQLGVENIEGKVWFDAPGLYLLDDAK